MEKQASLKTLMKEKKLKWDWLRKQETYILLETWK